MYPIFTSKRGFSPAGICAAVFCLLLTVGCVISPRRTLGGGGGTPTPTPTASPTPTGSPTPTPVPTGKLYVMESNSNTLLRFDNAFTASGNATPAVTIAGNNTTFNFPGFMTLDTTNDSLYIADTGDLSVVIYDGISTKSSGNIAPSRNITGSLVSPTDVSLDKVRNLLYVADDLDIHVYASASTANGTPTPVRDLSVNFQLSGIYIDGANDRLYVADSAGNAVAVYDHASTLASGLITADRAVQGAATHLSGPGSVQVDGAGRLVVSNSLAPSITIYANAATADNNIAPVAEIAGAATGFSVPTQIFVDTTGTGTLYNADPGAARVAVWGNLNTANSNIAPTRVIFGANTGITASGQLGLALDTTR
jgi:sugar lactone lactonase YvrE